EGDRQLGRKGLLDRPGQARERRDAWGDYPVRDGDTTTNDFVRPAKRSGTRRASGKSSRSSLEVNKRMERTRSRADAASGWRAYHPRLNRSTRPARARSGKN